MQWINLINWFAGGKNSYHTLYQCMHGDTLWIAITVGSIWQLLWDIC